MADPRCGDFIREGQRYMGMDQVDQAIRSYDIAITLSKGTVPEYFILRAEANMELEIYDKAFLDADEAVRLDPRCRKGFEIKAKTSFLNNDFQSAAKYYRQILSFEPDDAVALDALEECEAMLTGRENFDDDDQVEEVEITLNALTYGEMEEEDLPPPPPRPSEKSSTLGKRAPPPPRVEMDTLEYGCGDDSGPSLPPPPPPSRPPPKRDDLGYTQPPQTIQTSTLSYGEIPTSNKKAPPLPPPSVLTSTLMYGVDDDDELTLPTAPAPRRPGPPPVETRPPLPPPDKGAIQARPLPAKPPPQPARQEAPPPILTPHPPSASPAAKPPMRSGSVPEPIQFQSLPRKNNAGPMVLPTELISMELSAGAPELKTKTMGYIVHNDMTRDEAETLLSSQASMLPAANRPGLFLLRTSSSVVGGVVLMVLDKKGKSFNFQYAKNVNGEYESPTKTVLGRNLIDLICYYQKHKEGLPCVLSYFVKAVARSA